MRHFSMLLLALMLGLSASAQTCTVQVDPAPCGGSMVLFSVPQRVTLDAGDGRTVPLLDAVEALHRLATYEARRDGKPVPSRSQAVAEAVSRVLLGSYFQAGTIARELRARKEASTSSMEIITEELASP